jgi:hypothetical protein
VLVFNFNSFAFGKNEWPRFFDVKIKKNARSFCVTQTCFTLNHAAGRQKISVFLPLPVQKNV